MFQKFSIAAFCITPVLCAAQARADDSASAGIAIEEPKRPWRVHEALGVPSWLRFGIEPRARFEHLEKDFHSTAEGNSTALFIRTLISAELELSPLIAEVEFLDARAYATDSTPLTPALVNALELLQAYAGLAENDLFTGGDSAKLLLGRFTMDVGSRRLVARNQFRNTLNAFTGIDLQWTGPQKQQLRGFAVLPVIRRPVDPAQLSDNHVEADRENTGALFWGIFGSSQPVARVQIESYVLGLHERDGSDTPSANRRIFTPGARIFAPPAAGKLDFELEAMMQLGTSRANTLANNTTDLVHRALSIHITGGYKFDAPWNPRVALEYAFASGDNAPNDRVNGRFDPLFDERRIDFGPVGLYGAFLRSNVNTPSIRVEVAPHETVDMFAHYQLFWLASARDAWMTAGLRDPSGASGSFVGHQIEGRLRWNLLPKNLAFEVVGAYLVRGEFAIDAPNAKSANPMLVYTQITGTI